ncbi:tetratricopeptide repeat protein [Chryseotalea sanaruensis]|uniref:Tetratricopeptide repeat protein n=1 Tax=Chryseotalea sanaruensis TaxID=2482724 RepID=A0A401U6R5_9BACT|nr:tetratricopeptide repeat protein [Chryseotalea sanaruensis]GCC50542.1 tetratricopeptide repeat protein [Chryseotalea sanaruensis]
MRKTALLVFTFLSFGVLAQTSKEYTQKGRELIGKHDYMEAILNLNKAIELDAKNSSAFFLRATLKEKFEDLHGAMKDYNTAIEANPKSADAFFARGNVKMRLQDYYGAIEDFSAAIAVNENFVEAYFSRGKAKQLLMAYEDAINDVTKIIQINPKSVDAYYMRGILRIDFGDMKNGCLDLSKAGELGDLRAYEVIKEKCNTKVTGND